MTYLECRCEGRKVWIGPFAKALNAKAWLRHHQLKYNLRHIVQHDSRSKILFAAYEQGDLAKCVGVFEDNRSALAAAGKNGVVIDWRPTDTLEPEDSALLLKAISEWRRKIGQTSPPVEAV
jgi:hypothetical protein